MLPGKANFDAFCGLMGTWQYADVGIVNGEKNGDLL